VDTESKPEPFGDRLHRLLEQEGTNSTQAWLAQRSGVDRSLISRLITNQRRPTVEVLQCLAPALRIELVDLVRGTDAESCLTEIPNVVRRSDYEGVLAQMIEYEGKIRELVRDAQTKDDIIEQRKNGEEQHKASIALLEKQVEEQERELAQLRALVTSKEQELFRYRHALAHVVAENQALKQQFLILESELGETKKSSKAATILAGIAAVTGVATVAHLLDNADSQQSKSKPRPRKRKKKVP
jgi:transcriptional regulator with XRE-family HTH domain